MAGIEKLRRKSHLFQKRLGLRDIGHPGATTPCELPGEPLIYSIKIPVGQRVLSEQFFYNKAFFSKLRCWFRRWIDTSTPVVLMVTFYVTPRPNAKTKPTRKQLRDEDMPAVHAHECCDYLLSLMESLKHAGLFNNYEQLVKIDVQKFYSSRPRVVFQYMHYLDWDKFYGKHTFYTKAKVSPETGKQGLLQCELKEHAADSEGDSGQAEGSRPHDAAL